MKRILEEWKRFLEQKKDIYDDEYITMSEKQLESIFKVFHLSYTELNNENSFLFTPRVPRHPLRGEDDFTKRISLAPKINRAVYGLLQNTLKDQEALEEQFYVYAGDFKEDPDDDIKTVKLSVELRRCNKNLSYKSKKESRNNRYSSYQQRQHNWTFSGFMQSKTEEKFGTDKCYTLTNYADRQKCLIMQTSNSPSSLEHFGINDVSDLFYACVPDANDSKEEWSLKPISLYYIGAYIPKTKKIQVRPEAYRLIKQKLKNKNIKAKVQFGEEDV